MIKTDFESQKDVLESKESEEVQEKLSPVFLEH